MFGALFLPPDLPAGTVPSPQMIADVGFSMLPASQHCRILWEVRALRVTMSVTFYSNKIGSNNIAYCWKAPIIFHYTSIFSTNSIYLIFNIEYILSLG